jgi:hypothetical protein
MNYFPVRTAAHRVSSRDDEVKVARPSTARQRWLAPVITHPFFRYALGWLMGVFLPAAAHACATCGCSLNADAAMGYSSAAGWRLGFEYDFINQEQLRKGSSPISPSQVAAINDAGGNQEVERQTINRYMNLSVSYRPSADWNLNLLVPYISRSHTTYGAAMTSQLGPSDISGAQSTGLGDIKFIANYQGLLPTHNLGLQIGIKVPTGDYGGQNIVTGATVGHNPVFFTSGPNAASGSALDTSLNTGTGTTDAIFGAYYYQAVSQDFDAYASVQFEFAFLQNLNQPNADYRPGNLATLSFGTRYEADHRLIPQLQVNITRKGADGGALADTADTAGTVVYLSPGVTVGLRPDLHVYGFIQVPVYSELSGYQLFPHWTGSIGLSYLF